MYQITLGIDGMMCGMCESHINDAVRNAFPVKKVSSSHSKGQTVILSETEIPEAELKPVIAKTGYELTSTLLLHHRQPITVEHLHRQPPEWYR